jgi:fibronectin-binding autotransporter adhesin
MDANSVNTVGNDTTCWVFPVANVLFQGNVYSDDATTVPSFCDSSTTSVKVRFNGVLYGPNACTTGTGVFSITGPVSAPAAGTILFVWIDGATCGANNSTGSCGGAIVRYNGSGNITSIKLRKNRLVLRSDSGSLLDSELAGWTNTDDSDVVYAAAAGSLTTEDQIKLVVDVGTFAPGGTVTTDTASSSGITDGDLTITSGATLSMGTNALSVGGDFVNSGTFSKSSGQTTTFTATASGFTITPGTGNFDVLTLNGASGGWTMGAAGTADGNLTITAGTLTLGAFAFTATGTTSISGSLLCPSAATCAGLKTFTGALTVASGGIFDLTTSSTVATSLFSAGITQSSNVANSFKAGTGAAQLVGNLAGAGTGGINFGAGLTINSGTTSNGYTGGTVTVTGTLTLTSGNWSQANGSTLSLGSTTPFGGAGTFSASTATNTVNYTASGALTVKDPDAATTHTYSNLTLSGSGAKTMTGITTAKDFTMSNGATTTGNVMTTISGNLDLSSASTVFTTGAALIISGTAFVHDGATLALGAFTFEVDGNATVGDGATGIFTGTSGTAITLKGNLSLAAGATWTKMTSGTVTFSKGAAQTITDSTAGQDLGVVALTTASTSVSTSSNIKLTSLNIGGSTTFDATGDIILFTGSGTAGARPLVNSGTLTTTSSTFDFEGSAASDIETTSTTYANLTVGGTSDGGGSVTYTMNGSTTVSGLLTVGNSGSTNADTLALGATTLTLSGSSSTPLTLAGNSKGLLSAGTSTVQYTGTSATLAAATFNNLSLGTGSTASSTIPAGGISLTGNLSIGTSSTVTKGGTVTFSKGGAQSWTDANANDIGAVVTSGASTNLQLSSNVKATSLNIVGSTTFTPGSNTLELTGTGTPLTVGGTFTVGTSTIKYTGATATITSTTFNNLTLGSGSAVTYTTTASGSNITLRGNLSIANNASITKGATGGGTFVFASGGTQTWTDSNGTAQDIGPVQVSANGTASTLNLLTSVKAATVTIDSSQFFSANGSNTLTLTGTGTALAVSGTFTPSTGTVSYTGTTANLNAMTYNALTLGSGTYTAPAGTMTLTSDFTNNGTFTHNSGTVVLAPAATGTIQILGTSSTGFYNLNDTVAGSTIKIKNGNTLTINNTLTLTGTSSRPIDLASTVNGSQWTVNFVLASNNITISFITVKDSACSGNNISNTLASSGHNDTIQNRGNNGSCWLLTSRGGGPVGGGGNGGSSGGGSGTSGGCSGTTLCLVQKAVNESTTNSNTVAVTVTSTVGGRLMIALASGSASMTATSVVDNASSPNTYTHVSNAASSGTGGIWTDAFYCANCNAGATSITLTVSATSTAVKQIYVFEVAAADTVPFDIAAVTSNATGSSNTDTGAAVTTTNANDFIASVVNTAGTVASIKAANAFTLGNISSSSDASAYMIASSIGTYTPQWTDGTAAPATASTTVAFKQAGSGGGSSGGGGGTLPQTFNGTNGALTTYDSNWNNLGGSFSISSNTVYSSTASTDTMSRWTAGTFNDNQYAELTISTAGTGYIGVGVRLQSGAQTGYGLYCNATDMKLIEWAAGVQTTVHYTGSACSANDVIRLEVSGTNLTVKKNGSTLTTVSDSTYSTGRPGLVGKGNAQGDASGVTFGDTFYADSILGGGGGGGGGSP